MCYAYKPAPLPGIKIPDHASETSDGFHYPTNAVPVVVRGEEARVMRWDLIPRGFLRNENLTASEALRKKNSRALNPATGKSWGFTSYNARIETVESLWTFKEAWREGNRGVISVTAFRERPNMDGAPPESKGREFEITLDQIYYLAALFDTWKSKDGETVESCTVITGPSDDVPALQGIYHERTPILLSHEDCEAWLNPATTPKAALALLRAAKVPKMTVVEVPKKEKLKKEKPVKVRKEKVEKKKAKKEDDLAVDLFGI
jgi:putative SOS response-associated peptidase YedK